VLSSPPAVPPTYNSRDCRSRDRMIRQVSAAGRYSSLAVLSAGLPFIASSEL